MGWKMNRLERYTTVDVFAQSDGKEWWFAIISLETIPKFGVKIVYLNYDSFRQHLDKMDNHCNHITFAWTAC